MREQIISFLAATLIKCLGATLRFDLVDRAGIVKNPPSGPMIFLFWHNRLLMTPYLIRKFLPHRHVCGLVSASRDGEVLDRTLARFGIKAARGSSSRQGARALRQLYEAIEEGSDVAVTPDGPRGPMYEMHPGVVSLACNTRSPLVPVGIKFSSAWRLKSWDRFYIPKPFSRVTVEVGEQMKEVADPQADPTVLKEVRERLMQITHDEF